MDLARPLGWVLDLTLPLELEFTLVRVLVLACARFWTPWGSGVSSLLFSLWVFGLGLWFGFSVVTVTVSTHTHIRAQARALHAFTLVSSYAFRVHVLLRISNEVCSFRVHCGSCGAPVLLSWPIIFDSWTGIRVRPRRLAEFRFGGRLVAWVFLVYRYLSSSPFVIVAGVDSCADPG